MRFALIDKTGRVENVVEAESAEKLAALFLALTVLPHGRAGLAAGGWRFGGAGTGTCPGTCPGTRAR